MSKIHKITFIALIVMFPVMSLAQSAALNSFLVAGHVYGAHAGKNIGLHPPLLEQLQQMKSSDYFALFLTGDIVNNSTEASWAQVEKELEMIGIPSYYAMGNHDDNTLGHAVFNKKHGATYYSFNHGNDCFIVLDSPKSDRSISSDQLVYLKEVFQGTGSIAKRVFIFFHEVIWNSDVKYKGVMSNSRSRYDQLVKYSNFWTDVFPMLKGYTEKHFYLFAGDVGGNTDAIAAFYDVRENVTLLASGMGEVADENMLKVDLYADTVKFTFLPLNNQQTMSEAPYYAVPKAPEAIVGPEKVGQGVVSSEYWVDPVFNASSYEWKLPDGVAGDSDSSMIAIAFSDHFSSDTLAVCAVKSGYGKSEPTKLFISRQNTTSSLDPIDQPSLYVELLNVNNELYLQIRSNSPQDIRVDLFNTMGQCIQSTPFSVNSEGNRIPISHGFLEKRLMIIQIANGNKKKVLKATF